MKKFLIDILLFLMVYVVLHTVAICVFGNNKYIDVTYYRIGSYGHMYSRIKEIQNCSDPDILFLGSSHCYRSFDNRIFTQHGIKTFNFGSSSQTPKQTEVLLKKYLDTLNPKFIVFEVYPNIFQSDGIESTTDLISNDHIDREIIELAINTTNLKVINTLIYGLFQEYVVKTRQTFREEINKDGDCYISGGFVEKLDYSPYASPESSRFVTLTLRSDQIKAFERCIEMIQSRGIPYMLVEAPLPEKTYLNITNHDEFCEKMSSCGRFIDFNEIIHLDDTCFFDSDHLAQPGVQLFDECLIKVLDTIQ